MNAYNALIVFVVSAAIMLYFSGVWWLCRQIERWIRWLHIKYAKRKSPPVRQH